MELASIKKGMVVIANGREAVVTNVQKGWVIVRFGDSVIPGKFRASSLEPARETASGKETSSKEDVPIIQSADRAVFDFAGIRAVILTISKAGGKADLEKHGNPDVLRRRYVKEEIFRQSLSVEEYEFFSIVFNEYGEISDDFLDWVEKDD